MRALGWFFLLLLLAAVPARAEEEDAPEPLWKRCYTAVKWFHAAEVPDTEAVMVKLVMSGKLAEHSREWIRAAIKAAPTIDECLAEAKRRGKLLFWYVPAVEGQHIVLPHLLDRYMMVGPLSHPDVTAILNRRFVCLKLPGGGALAKRFDLVVPKFIQPGLLIFKPDGTVVHRMDRINTFNADYFRFMLEEVLRRHGDGVAHSESYETAKAGLEGGDPESQLRFGQEALLEGESEDARLAFLRAAAGDDEVVSQRAKLGLVALARRDRQPARAARYLEGIHHPAVVADSLVEGATVLLKSGNYGAASGSFRRALERNPPGSRRAEALYLLGVARYALGNDTAAVEAWKRAIETDEGSIWPAKADACAATGTDGRPGEAALIRSMELPCWMDDEVYRLAADTQWRRAPHDVGSIVDRAGGFLLTQQRADGSWRGFRWGGGAEGSPRPIARDNFEAAIAALCASALLAWRGDVRNECVETALRAADTYLLEKASVVRGEAYVWVYADGFRLMHYARRLAAKSAPAGIKARMRRWIRHLLEHQEANDDSWRHYVYKSTFVTAAVTYCLHAVREAGLEVPDAAFEKAAATLESARGGPRGLYGYLLDNPAVTRDMLGAGNRQPLCEWAQHIAGKADTKRMQGALEIFLEAYPKSAALARKTNFHIPSLGNTAGYYFFHNFYAACEAARLTGKDAKKNMDRLLGLLCELPEIDGSFIDCGFSYGKSYSTAMALLSLKALTEPLPE